MGAFKIPAVLPPSPKGQCHLVKDRPYGIFTNQVILFYHKVVPTELSSPIGAILW